MDNTRDDSFLDAYINPAETRFAADFALGIISKMIAEHTDKSRRSFRSIDQQLVNGSVPTGYGVEWGPFDTQRLVINRLSSMPLLLEEDDFNAATEDRLKDVLQEQIFEYLQERTKYGGTSHRPPVNKAHEIKRYEKSLQPQPVTSDDILRGAFTKVVTTIPEGIAQGLIQSRIRTAVTLAAARNNKRVDIKAGALKQLAGTAAASDVTDDRKVDTMLLMSEVGKYFTFK